MNFYFLPWVLITILVIGWLIGIVQANKKSGFTIFWLFFSVYMLGFTSYIASLILKNQELLKYSSLALSISSIPIAAYLYNEKSKVGVTIYTFVAISNGLIFLLV